MSGFYTTSNMAAERAKIDDHISRLERELRDLRQLGNALAPISRLPPELLLESFRVCRDCAVSDGELTGWIAEITHVCQHWRKLALSACTLWARPDFLRPVLAAEMLRRSGSSSLLDITFERDTELAESTLTSEISRVRSLNVKIPECSVNVLAYAGPAPFLERLKFVDADFNQDWYTAGYRLPAQMFSGIMPNLRILHLEGVSAFDLSHSSCAYLECLSLKSTSMPSIEHMHTVILSMKRLRELVICNCIPDVPEEGYSPSPIALPNLRKLSATDGPSCLAAFLTPLQCTLSATGTTPALKIRCIRLHSHGSIDITPFITQISRWASRSLAAPFNTLKIYGHALRVRAAPASLDFSLAPSNWPSLEAFILALPLPAIETVSASGPYSTKLGAVLARAQGLKTLDLDDGCADSVLQDLGRDASGDVPRLQHLVLRNLRPPPDVRMLWRMLERRLPPDDEKAKAILAFHGCGETPPSALEELVGQEARLRVWWDNRCISVERYEA